MMNFEDFKLPYGYPLSLEGASVGGEPFKYASKLVGCVPGELLMVTMPRAGKATTLRSGQKLLIKIMAGNGVLAFASVVTQLISQPKPIICLGYPGKLSFKEIRGATRVDTQTPINVVNSVALEPLSSAGIVSDISLSGARIEMKKEIGTVGETVIVSGEVSIAKLHGVLELPAVIRSRVERSTRESEAEYPAIYGIEFANMSDEQMLLLYAFVFSQLVDN